MWTMRRVRSVRFGRPPFRVGVGGEPDPSPQRSITGSTYWDITRLALMSEQGGVPGFGRGFSPNPDVRPSAGASRPIVPTVLRPARDAGLRRTTRRSASCRPGRCSRAAAGPVRRSRAGRSCTRTCLRPPGLECPVPETGGLSLGPLLARERAHLLGAGLLPRLRRSRADHRDPDAPGVAAAARPRSRQARGHQQSVPRSKGE